jgi:hypothetical protein
MGDDVFAAIVSELGGPPMDGGAGGVIPREGMTLGSPAVGVDSPAVGVEEDPTGAMSMLVLALGGWPATTTARPGFTALLDAGLGAGPTLAEPTGAGPTGAGPTGAPKA